MLPSALIKAEIDRFLSSSSPDVLCIKGKWGVGKTYSWGETLTAASERPDGVALAKYAYVSLFGINSVDELKYAIFSNTLPRENLAGAPSLESLGASMSIVRNAIAKNNWILDVLPWTRSLNSAIAPALFMTVRGQLICIDDLERRGQKLELADVLGLVSFLKEDRKCKVVLLLNDEELVGDARQAFDKYLEKVVDTTLTYKTTPDEAIAKAGIKGDEIGKHVSECCAALGLSNIRVIKKIDRLVRLARPRFSQYDPEVFRQATRSLVMLCWAFHQPGEAPTFEFLRTKKTDLTYGLKNDDLTPREIAWNALLSSYGFLWVDDLDLVLMKAVEDGYFDPEALSGPAAKADEKAKSAKADGSFEDAWRTYHDSFDDNQDSVLAAIYESFVKSFKYVSPLNLNGTVKLFKALGHGEQANEMIQAYVNGRDEPREFFDLDRYPFGGNIDDPDVRAAFAEKAAKLAPSPNIPNMLMALKDGGWDEETLELIASLSVEEFHKVLVEVKGVNLRRIISGCLQFNRIGNATEAMLKISTKATEALQRIAATSQLNARRVASYGIKPAEIPDSPKA